MKKIYKLKRTFDDSLENEELKNIHRFNFPKIVKKNIQELQGLSAAIVYDGVINDSEIELIKTWLKKNKEYLVEYPLSDLNELFNEIIEDNVIDEKERKRLLVFLESIASSPESSEVVDGIFTNKPKISFEGKNFLFTGKLNYDSRSKAENKVKELGGDCQKRVTLDTHYLIVGDLGSQDYKYSRYGSKIEKAIKYNRERGTRINIVRENDFISEIINRSK